MRALLSKAATLLDELTGLVQDTRAYVRLKNAQAVRTTPDLFGPRGTEVRLDYPRQPTSVGEYTTKGGYR